MRPPTLRGPSTWYRGRLLVGMIRDMLAGAIPDMYVGARGTAGPCTPGIVILGSDPRRGRCDPAPTLSAPCATRAARTLGVAGGVQLRVASRVRRCGRDDDVAAAGDSAALDPLTQPAAALRAGDAGIRDDCLPSMGSAACADSADASPGGGIHLCCRRPASRASMPFRRTTRSGTGERCDPCANATFPSADLPLAEPFVRSANAAPESPSRLVPCCGAAVGSAIPEPASCKGAAATAPLLPFEEGSRLRGACVPAPRDCNAGTPWPQKCAARCTSMAWRPSSPSAAPEPLRRRLALLRFLCKDSAAGVERSAGCVTEMWDVSRPTRLPSSWLPLPGCDPRSAEPRP
jgi:hypothetical protein